MNPTGNPKDKRNSIRIPLLSEKVMIGQGQYFEIADITPYGLFVKIENSQFPTVNSTLEVTFQLPGDLGPLSISAQVVRISWAKTKRSNVQLGYGVKFVDVRPGHKKILDAYVTYLRNKQIITVSKRIIEEFFNGNPRAY